jgi:hypothetical protein
LGFEPVVSLEDGIKAYISDIKHLHGTDISWLICKESRLNY